jgi:hypothetical protein
MAGDRSLTGTFEELVHVTLGVRVVDDEEARGDRVLRRLPPSLVRAVAEEFTTAEEGDPTDPVASEEAEAMVALDAFDRKLAALGDDRDAESKARQATITRGSYALATDADAAVGTKPVRRKAPIGVGGFAWSAQAAELSRAVAEQRTKQGGASLHRFTARGFIYEWFKELKLVNMRIESIDARSASLSGLRELNLSGNRVRVLEHLPRNLEALQFFGNGCEEVSQNVPLDRCIHAGLGFNRIRSMESVLTAFPSLLSLDLSCNSLCDLDAVCSALAPLKGQLRFLELFGNPCSLVRGYRSRVAHTLAEERDDSTIHGLEILDGVPVSSRDLTPPEATPVVSLMLSVTGLSGMPRPASVPGWSERQAELDAAKAPARGGKAPAKAGKGTAKEEPTETDAALPPPPMARLVLREHLLKDVDAFTHEFLRADSSPLELPRLLEGGGLEAPWDHPLEGAPSVALRDALMLHGLHLELHGESSCLLSGLVPCKSLFEALPARVSVAVPVKLLQLPPSTVAAANDMARFQVRQAATEGAEGGKKPAKKAGKAAPEEETPLSAEQEAEALALAEATCAKLLGAAVVEMSVTIGFE